MIQAIDATGARFKRRIDSHVGHGESSATAETRIGLSMELAIEDLTHCKITCRCAVIQTPVKRSHSPRFQVAYRSNRVIRRIRATKAIKLPVARSHGIIAAMDGRVPMPSLLSHALVAF